MDNNGNIGATPENDILKSVEVTSGGSESLSLSDVMKEDTTSEDATTVLTAGSEAATTVLTGGMSGTLPGQGEQDGFRSVGRKPQPPQGSQGPIPQGPQNAMPQGPQGPMSQNAMAQGPQGPMSQNAMAQGPQGPIPQSPQNAMPQGPQGPMSQNVMAQPPQGMTGQMAQGPQGMTGQMAQPPQGMTGQMAQPPQGMTGQMAQPPQGMTGQMAQPPQGMTGQIPQGAPPLPTQGMPQMGQTGMPLAQPGVQRPMQPNGQSAVPMDVNGRPVRPPKDPQKAEKSARIFGLVTMIIALAGLVAVGIMLVLFVFVPKGDYKGAAEKGFSGSSGTIPGATEEGRTETTEATTEEE